MRILVTGGTGFIGVSLLRNWVGRHELVALVREGSRLESGAGIETIVGSLTERRLAEKLPSRMDAIVHLAQGSVPFPDQADELFEVNAASIQRLAEYGRRVGIRSFVFSSTGNVYRRTSRPLAEADECQAADFYALTKICAEEILRFYRTYFHVCILRIFAPYGPGQRNRLIPALVDRVWRGTPIELYNGGEPALNPIFITDLLTALEKGAQLEGVNILNAAGPDRVTLRDIGLLAGRLLGKEPVFRELEREESWNLIADNQAFKRAFGFTAMVGMKEGLRKFVDWFRRDESGQCLE